MSADFLLCTEAGARGAASKGLDRIPQEFWFLASRGSSTKHPSPHGAQGSWAKWNVPEASAADWSHSCLILICICSGGRFYIPHTQNKPASSSYCNHHHILAPNSPIPKSGFHLKPSPFISVNTQSTTIHREQFARTFWNGSSESEKWHWFAIFLRDQYTEYHQQNLSSPNIWYVRKKVQHSWQM